MTDDFYAEELLTTAVLAVTFDAEQHDAALFAAAAACDYFVLADSFRDPAVRAQALEYSEKYARIAYYIVNEQIGDGLPS